MNKVIKWTLIGFVIGFALFYVFLIFTGDAFRINIIDFYDELLFGEGYAPFFSWGVIILSTLIGFVIGINKKE